MRREKKRKEGGAWEEKREERRKSLPQRCTLTSRIGANHYYESV
jgi:hypothetical protein